jgi:beta-glucosidase
VAATYGDLVFGWKPINEPVAYAANGFISGVNPPGVQDMALATEVVEGAHLANLVAWQVLRETAKPVSTVHALIPVFPVDESDQAAEAASLVDALVWDSWIRPLSEGILALPGRPHLAVPEYRGAFDLVGFSYYSAAAVAPPLELRPYPHDGTVGAMGYVPWSEGIGLVLDRLAVELPGRPLLICEHGVGTHDDTQRCSILADSLELVAQRLERGQDIRGFFHWTGVDNYEWAQGWGVPFGLFDQDRQPRPSAELLRRVATSGELQHTTSGGPP